MAHRLPQDNYDTYLTTSIGASDATIAVNVAPTQTAGFLTIFASDGVTFSEKILYTGVTGTNLTGCVRGIATVPTAGVYSETAGTGTTHVAGARIAMTDNVNYIGLALSILNGDTAAGGVIQNPASRTINSSRDLCDKEYVDATSTAAGGLTAFYVTQNGADPSLTVNIGSGYLILGSTATTFAGASAQAVTDNATNYVQLTIAGAVVINTTGFTDGNIPLAIVVASGADITGITDARGWITMALTPNQVAALAGSLGTPSAVNKFLTAIDSSSGLDQSQTTRDATRPVGEADATTKNNKLAQSFTAGNINSTGVELNKQADTGTFSGTVTISLQADTAGSPSGTPLATVTINNAAWLLQNAGSFLARWGTAYNAMTVGATYWYVIQTTTSDNSNHPNLGTNSAGGYAGGGVKLNNTTDGWVTVATIDLYFRGLTTRADKVVRADSTGEVTGQLPYGTDAGATDAYEWNFLTDDITYVDGKIYPMKVATANTGACTGNINGWGAKSCKKNHNIALETGDLVANMQAAWQYNSTTDTLNLVTPRAAQGLQSAARMTNGNTNNKDFRVSSGTIPVFNSFETYDILGEMDDGYQAVTCTAGTNTTTVVASGATFSAADVGRYWYNDIRAGSAAGQLITVFNSPTSITINSAVGSQASGDTGFVYSGKFTAAATGYYAVTSLVHFGSVGAAASVASFIYKNGSAILQGGVQMGSTVGTGNNFPITLADVVQLTAGDTLQCFMSSSGTIAVGAAVASGGLFTVKRVA